ncbi:uncharacterized protein Tco025E_00192 [Trypanosoma conorhini]|uniref:Zinc-ribbon domain-containing protein n=1 Tax=Trypanosoma conorhini TaxID=83891 RepID=A0A3R7P1V8_9TRYP|nr:uncharacterized protein Tco025E_00192 [Trypanosoma conorhini]RNF27542.1 hypothetical protein Tco025E_00192 [Trypanosoma conorhini]
MGEEDARRLLSAEPIRSPELLSRLMPHNTAARLAAAHVPKKHSPEKAASRSPTNQPASRSPIEKSASRSPIEKVVPRSPTNQSASRSPIEKSASRSPIEKTVPRSPTIQPASRSPIEKTVSRSPIEKTVSRSPVAKELPSEQTAKTTALTKATTAKESTPQEAKQPRVPIPTRNSFLGVDPAAPVVPVVIADKPKTGESPGVQRQSAAAATRPSLGKSTEMLEVLVSTGAGAKRSSSPRDRKAASFPPSQQRRIKSTNGSSKVTVVFSGEPKTKTQSQPERRIGGLGHGPLAVTGQAATANMRRRASAAATRVTTWRRDEPAPTLEKDVLRGTKSRSPLHSSEAGSTASKPPALQQLSWRRKSLSVLTLAASRERDPYCPLNTDRRVPNKVRAVRRGPIGELESPKQLVPFCTECGKRHLSEKVKFCAFCGHKRECVR